MLTRWFNYVANPIIMPKFPKIEIHLNNLIKFQYCKPVKALNLLN